ncbi:MAG: HesB/IscA family protein [Rubripirellula sp.]
MPLFTKCRFCHKNVVSVLMSLHQRKHAKRLPDGQQRDHVTEPPDQRFQGSLDGVPKHYRHAKCQRVTGMPEEIIRSYLANPSLYNDHTFCVGCGDYIHMSELDWVETGQNLLDYMDELRSKARQCPIKLTDAAVDALRDYANGEEPRIRVSVSRSARPEAGRYIYHLDLDSRPSRRGDRVFELESIEILIDQTSLGLINGTEIDFQTGPDGTGFRFDNPNAA